MHATQKTVPINHAQQEIHGFLRQLENPPRFVDHLECVMRIDELPSHRVAKGLPAPR